MCPDAACRCGNCGRAPGRNPSELAQYTAATYSVPRVNDVLRSSAVAPFPAELLATFHPITGNAPGYRARWTDVHVLPPRPHWDHPMPLPKVPLKWGRIGASHQVQTPVGVERNIDTPRSVPWDIDYVVGRR